MSLLDALGGGDDTARCSTSGCRAPAAHRVNWRNPRIHTPDRVKVWLACEAHRDHLRDYLGTRGFPVLVSALDSPVDAVPDPALDRSPNPAPVEPA